MNAATVGIVLLVTAAILGGMAETDRSMEPLFFWAAVGAAAVLGYAFGHSRAPRRE